jgi:putative membrane protein
MDSVRPLLAADEAEAVRAAVAHAETASGAEIVPVLVSRAGDHAEAAWKGAALGAMAGALVAALFELGRPAWGPAGGRLLLPVAVGALALALLSRVPAVLRALVGRARLEADVEAAARAAFLAHEVFATRERTGVLIFVALLERSVVVLADSGVHPFVPASEWRALAAAIAREMKTKSPGQALLAAVERAGGQVAALGPRRRTDDANELPDAPALPEG